MSHMPSTKKMWQQRATLNRNIALVYIRYSSKVLSTVLKRKRPVLVALHNCQISIFVKTTTSRIKRMSEIVKWAALRS